MSAGGYHVGNYSDDHPMDIWDLRQYIYIASV